MGTIKEARDNEEQKHARIQSTSHDSELIAYLVGSHVVNWVPNMNSRRFRCRDDAIQARPAKPISQAENKERMKRV
jgi:hypothetical protein